MYKIWCVIFAKRCTKMKSVHVIIRSLKHSGNCAALKYNLSFERLFCYFSIKIEGLKIYHISESPPSVYFLLNLFWQPVRNVINSCHHCWTFYTNSKLDLTMAKSWDIKFCLVTHLRETLKTSIEIPICKNSCWMYLYR